MLVNISMRFHIYYFSWSW